MSAADVMSANGGVVWTRFSFATLEVRPAGVCSEDGADEREVDDPVVDERRDEHLRDDDRGRVSVDLVDDDARGERRQREHRAVVGDAHRRASSGEMRDGRPDGDDEHAGRPAEQDDRRDREDEADGDASAPIPSTGTGNRSARPIASVSATSSATELAVCGCAA